MIRVAKNSDLPQIIKVCKEAHQLSVSKNVPLDEGVLKKNTQVCILSAEHLVNLVEIDGSIEGVFIGVTNQLWYSRKNKPLIFSFIQQIKGRAGVQVC